MNLELRNKRAIVCGSTQGIGKAIALELAKQGVSLTLIARNEQVLKTVLEKLDTSLAQTHTYLCVDFSDDNFKEKIDSLKDSNFDILINNTGGPAAGPITDADPKDFLLAFKMHLLNNQVLIQKVVAGMKKNSFGRIINIISTSVKAPIPGLGVSNTIRAAVANWAKTLSLELGPYGITVNNVLPGYTSTARLQELAEGKAKKLGISSADIYDQWKKNTSLKRLGTPEEIANTIIFLASDQSAYVTGHNLSVDGGRFGA